MREWCPMRSPEQHTAKVYPLKVSPTRRPTIRAPVEYHRGPESPGAAKGAHVPSHQAAIRRPSGELVAIRHLQLTEHIGHVRLDRLDRDEQLPGDFLVRVPP